MWTRRTDWVVTQKAEPVFYENTRSKRPGVKEIGEDTAYYTNGQNVDRSY